MVYLDLVVVSRHSPFCLLHDMAVGEVTAPVARNGVLMIEPCVEIALEVDAGRWGTPTRRGDEQYGETILRGFSHLEDAYRNSCLKTFPPICPVSKKARTEDLTAPTGGRPTTTTFVRSRSGE